MPNRSRRPAGILALGLVLVVGALAAAPAAGQLVPAPPNDDFSASEYFTLHIDDLEAPRADNVGATTEPGEPLSCGQRGFGATVWNEMRVSRTATVTMDTQGATYNTVLSVYTGDTLGSLTRVACNDDLSATSLQSRVQFTAHPGITYRIQVGGYNGATGSSPLNHNAPLTPRHDLFAEADQLPPDPNQQVPSSNIGATNESGEPRLCEGKTIGATVWFTLKVGRASQVTLDTYGVADFDTMLAVYTGASLGALTQVACNDDLSSATRQSRVQFNAAAGTTYRIQVGGYNGATGHTYLNVGIIPLCRGKAATQVGTAGHDILRGTDGPDVIVGLGGNDTIYGHGGNDLICGGPGDDTIYGGPGRDRLYGQGGADRLEGEAGNDRLFGGPGNDYLIGGDGIDRLRGQGGVNTCLGGEDVAC